MSIDLGPLSSATRVLFEVSLTPLQGKRFQPTGFPGLGAATFPTPGGRQSLLLESAQSMANRLEATIWDAATHDVVDAAQGISHVRVKRKDNQFLTDTILEAHRINSPYLLEESSKVFFNELKGALGGLDTGPIDRARLAEVLLDYDVGSLLHGIFLAKKELAGGRLRVARALSAFIEAENTQVAPSGGVKNDHVNPSGDTKAGFGNVPFARDEYTAEKIALYANIDLAQIRGYGLEPPTTRFLITLALYKLRALLDGDLRLRTACDLGLASGDAIVATRPASFKLPSLAELDAALRGAIKECGAKMRVREVVYGDELKKGSEKKASDDSDEGDGDAS